MSNIRGTKIHLDLDDIFIIKTNLDKIVFGLFKYASDKGYKIPFIFTANTTIKDNSYLGVLKNNNVRLVDKPYNEKDVDILFSGDWKKTTGQLLLIRNMPIFTKLHESRACVYIDWDNIQVSSNYIDAFIKGINDFINEIKVHKTYEIYTFLHNKISNNVKKLLKDLGVNIINIIKDKPRCGDEEMFGFIRKNTRPGDSICIASGDRDFSSLMVDYVRNSYNVFLIYNKQSYYTFKHNIHWLGSTDVKSLNGVESKKDTSYKHSSFQNQKLTYKTKPCKFHNLDICNAVSCSFLHICGVCGRPHKMKDFHPNITIIKNIICKKYNNGSCNYNAIDCDFLHICIKCNKPHPQYKCDNITPYCPLCNINMDSNKSYIIHQLDTTHLKMVEALKKIVKSEGKDRDSNHILIT